MSKDDILKLKIGGKMIGQCVTELYFLYFSGKLIKRLIEQ
jgi:hypothetical protein